MHVPVIPHAEGGLTRIKAILDYTVKAKIAPPPQRSCLVLSNKRKQNISGAPGTGRLLKRQLHKC